MSNDTSSEYRAALRDCPAAQAALHNWVSRTSKLAATAGLPPEDTQQKIVDTVSSESTPPCAIWEAVEGAYATQDMRNNAGGRCRNCPDSLRGVGAAYLDYLRIAASYDRDAHSAMEGNWSAETIALLEADLSKLLRAGARLEKAISRFPNIPLDGLRCELAQSKAVLARLKFLKDTSRENGGVA